MQGEVTGTPATDETSDAVLLLRTREGDPEAYGALYLRHVSAARVLARQLARDPSEADELVAESFTRVLSILQRGAGPEAALRPYLLSTMRRLHVDRRVAENRTRPTDDLTPHDPGLPFVDTPGDELERSIVSSAFTSLPERWRLVLWHTEVEGLPPAQVAPLLGISANATAALAVRARAGLRDAYLSAHVAGADDPTCREVSQSLGGYVRGTLSRRERVAVDAHLDTCARCSAAVLELSDTAATMRGVIGPLILGAAVLGYREGLIALGPHAIPSAALLHAGGLTLIQGGTGAGAGVGSGVGTGVGSGSGAAGTSGAAGAGSSGSGASAAGAAAGIAGRPVWQLVGAAGLAGAIVVAAVAAFALGGGSPDRSTASGPGSAPTAPQPSPTSSAVSTPSPSSTSPSTPTSPSTGSTSAGNGATAPAVGPGAPATTASTPPPVVPPPPTAGRGAVTTVGDLVPGRSGYLSVTVTNPGTQAAAQTVALHLPSGVSFNPGGVAPALTSGSGAQVRALAIAAASAPQSASSSSPCAASSGGATCILPTLAGGSSSHFVVPVSVSSGAGNGQWTALITSTAGTQHSTRTTSGALSMTTSNGVSALFAGRGHYRVSAVGNSLMSCQDPTAPVDPTCTAVESGRSGSKLVDDDWTMFPRNDAGTGWKSSSTAHISLPAGSTVVRAWLTWSGTGLAAPSTAAVTVQAPSASARTLSLDSGSPTDSLTPISVGGHTGYVAVKDVTGDFSGWSGDWTVGNIDLGDPGAALYGGWSLTVLTSQSSAPLRSATVLAGPHVLATDADWTGQALGLDDDPADLTMVAWEGDDGLTGDELSVHGAALTPQDRFGVADDVAASYSMGALNADGTARGLTFGVDVRAFSAKTGHGGDIRVSTSGDNFVLGLLAVTAG